MERKISLPPKLNSINHANNLSRLDGYYYKGTYYKDGIGNPGKVVKEARLNIAAFKIGGQTELTFKK